jgi:hypothetical protein
MNQPPNPGQPSPDPAQPPDYSQPVAYDKNGNPLYAYPPAGYQPGVQVVQITRPINPVVQPISPEAMQRYEESRLKYPNLNLSPGEYIISTIKRHPIGLVQIWLVIVLLIFVFGALFSMLFLGGDATNVLSSIGGTEDTRTGATLLLMVLFFLFILGGMAATYIYQNNRFYLTNESVIQEIQTTLFSKHEQTVSLSNIEDASYRQNGILPMLLNFGTIRLSTEGDETTYRFSYVADPKKHIAILNNAVEAFKNGRPVQGPNQDQPS